MVKGFIKKKCGECGKTFNKLEEFKGKYICHICKIQKRNKERLIKYFKLEPRKTFILEDLRFSFSDNSLKRNIEELKKEKIIKEVKTSWNCGANNLVKRQTKGYILIK